ncbi:MAG: flagellar brake protein [Pseudomonadota bacterium]
MDNRAAVAPYNEAFQPLSDRTYILTLLQSLVRRRVLVSVWLPGSDLRHISTVLDLDPQGNTLLLDEIFPRQVDTPPTPATPLTFHAQMAGAELAFAAEVEARIEEEGLQFYRLRLPATVDYLQRREGHRVVVTALDIRAELYDHQGRAQRGQLYDISTGGASLLLPRAGTFHPNDLFRCTLYLPGESPFSCKLDISSLREVEQGVVIGGSFAALGREAQRVLPRLVAELERRLVRRRWEPREQPDGD